MHARFTITLPVRAPAAVVFEVLTDYASYPTFHQDVTDICVLHKDGAGAELTLVGRPPWRRPVRAVDRYRQRRDVVVERSVGGRRQTSWTIHAVDADRSTITIDTSHAVARWRARVARPLLRHAFERADVAPFIAEAERRTRVSVA